MRTIEGDHKDSFREGNRTFVIISGHLTNELAIYTHTLTVWLTN